MIVTVTCVECVKLYSTHVSQESVNQYQGGIPAEIAFYEYSENARNLIVDKMCPSCVAELSAVPEPADPAEDSDNGWYTT